jgi:glycosyltransferase involved in cell wall biosynthesis
MQILHISAIGLTVKNLLTPQIDYFRSLGYTVEAACSPGPEVEQLRQMGYNIHPIPIDRRIDPIRNFKSLIQLTQLMQQQQYDLVHLHTPIASVLGRVAAKLAGVPRIVYTAHGFPFHDQSSPSQYQFYFNVEKLSAQFTDLILTQNHEDLLTARQQNLCPPEKVDYLGNGIDLDRFHCSRIDPTAQRQLRHSLGVPDHAGPIIGTIGRLTRKKGSGLLVEAAAKLLPQFPNLHILIIGGQLNSDPEPFQTELVERIQHLGLDNHVTLTGYRQDTPELLALLDIFTLPTYTHEGLPRSIIEAMAMAKPVVATDIRGCREAVIHETTGYIVPPRNSAALAEALGTLLANPDLCQAYGQAGRQRVQAEYDETVVFRRLHAAYQNLGLAVSCANAVAA